MVASKSRDCCAVTAWSLKGFTSISGPWVEAVMDQAPEGHFHHLGLCIQQDPGLSPPLSCILGSPFWSYIRMPKSGALSCLMNTLVCGLESSPLAAALPQNIWASLVLSSRAVRASSPAPPVLQEHLELVTGSEIRQSISGVFFYYIFRNT